MKRVFSWAAVCVLLLGISPSVHGQTEVTLLAPNPVRRTIDKLIAGFESKTGYKLKVTYGKGLGTRRQVARGEIFDVSILLPPYPEALASGNIDSKSAKTLASLTLGLAVKKGAPKPDISTPKAVRQTLLAAKTIAFVDPTSGSDGFATRDALQKLGVIDLIDSKIQLAPTASATAKSVAAGEADVCIFYFNEMVNPDIDAVGRLPKQFAVPVKVVAFISTHVHDANAAKALVDYLSSPDAEAIYEKDGLEPLVELLSSVVELRAPSRQPQWGTATIQIKPKIRLCCGWERLTAKASASRAAPLSYAFDPRAPISAKSVCLMEPIDLLGFVPGHPTPTVAGSKFGRPP